MRTRSPSFPLAAGRLRAATVAAMVRIRFAACNGSRTPMRPAAAEGDGGAAAAAAGDRLSRTHRQHPGLRLRRSRRPACRAFSPRSTTSTAPRSRRAHKLFGIERDIYQAQVDQQEAALASDEATEEYNKAEYQRQATLARQDFASQATVQEWKSKADQAAAEIINAQAAIVARQDQPRLHPGAAPLSTASSPIISSMSARWSASPAPTKLATIIQTDPLYVYFTLSEPQILAIKEPRQGTASSLRTTDLSDVPVEIGLQGEDGYPHKGHMDYASPQVDFATGTLTARALFDNKDGTLLPGLFVRVRTPIAQHGQGAAHANDRDRDEPGGELRAGGRRRQCRPEQGRQDRGARRTAAGDRVGPRARPTGW